MNKISIVGSEEFIKLNFAKTLFKPKKNNFLNGHK